MKFRTLSRLNYLKRARHRGGHGIHSPFLFVLITQVLEDKRRLNEYKLLKGVKSQAQLLLNALPDSERKEQCSRIGIRQVKKRKFYNKVEIPIRFLRVLFRLIREFKPGTVSSYGPTLGVNLAALSLAQSNVIVCHYSGIPEIDLLSKEVTGKYVDLNINYSYKISQLPIDAEFVVINYPYNDGLTRECIQLHFSDNLDNNVFIIRGIHESKQMEEVWQELIDDQRVRVSLDLFEIGIVLFMKRLQKESFILKF